MRRIRRSEGTRAQILQAAATTRSDECLFTLYPYRASIPFNGVTTSATRIVWELATGQSPGTLHVLHTCHRGDEGCININHLYLGNHLQNMADRKAVGHYGSGADNPSARLTESDVRDIRRRRAAGETLKDIAAVYDVHLSTIHLIATGKKWGWLE